jgi:hypothetical protein
VDLFRDCEGIVTLDSEATHGAFDFRVLQQQVHGTQVTRAPVDQPRLVRRGECVPKRFG